MEDQAFLRSYDLAPPRPPISNFPVSIGSIGESPQHTERLRQERKLADGRREVGGGGEVRDWGGAKPYDGKNA
jgi:hypothetical protein